MSSFSEEKNNKKLATKWLRVESKLGKKFILSTVYLGFISGILLILQMYCLAHIADQVYIQKSTPSELTIYFAFIIAIIIVRAFLAWVKEKVSFKASAIIRQNIRGRIYKHIQRLGPVGILKLNAGQLVSSAIEQTEALNNYFVKYLPQMSIAVYIPLAILVFVFPISITSALLLLVCAPLIPLFMALVGMGAESLHQKNFAEISKMSQFFLDTLQGLVSLKLLGRSKDQSKAVFTASDEYRKKTMGVLRVAFLSSAVLEVFAAASIALLAIYLGMGFINNGTGNDIWWGLKGITLEGALFILLLAPEFFLPLRELGTYYHSRAEAIGAAIEIQKVFDLKVNTNNVIEVKRIAKFDKQEEISLKLKNVSFRYDGTKNSALSNININIHPKEKIAIIGESGSGKSTFMNLLLRFIYLSSGEIVVNNTSLYGMSETDWYDNVSWLGQNPIIFSGTIRENLMLAKERSTDEELWSVLAQANLESTVRNLPDQLDTFVGENNTGLSGGQAQRLALARAYLKNTPLLLLDEPTASLDIENEKLVINAIEKNWMDKTVLLSTHRVSVLEKMDKILVLDEGVLIQFGTYKELIEDKNGYLFSIVNLMGVDA